MNLEAVEHRVIDRCHSACPQGNVQPEKYRSHLALLTASVAWHLGTAVGTTAWRPSPKQPFI